MIILVYSALQAHSIQDGLGVSDYSYYFVLKRYLPLLRELGEVRVLDAPPDAAQQQALAAEGPCVFLSFTPPGKAARLEQLPSIPVFAWEYSTIPDEPFGQPEDDWVSCLRQAGRAITHSSFTVDVVRAQVGEDYDIVSVPAPLWDDMAGMRELRAASAPTGFAGLDLHCTVIDSRDYALSNTLISPADVDARGGRTVGTPWDGETLEFRFTSEDDMPGLVGFNKRENWGTWSRSGYPWILLEEIISGDIEIEVDARGYEQHIGRELTLRIGDGRASLPMGEEIDTHTLRMRVTQPSNFIMLEGISEPAVSDADPRDLAVALTRIRIRRVAGAPAPADPGPDAPAPAPAAASAEAGGVLYTTILNPADGRKNWEDIVTAFVYAFRDRADATLLIKISSQKFSVFMEDIFAFWMELHPFACRIVFIHGYLSDTEYSQLVQHSHYIVNASRGEGQCLPLMEFMSSGVPAIAPDNSAMRDYMHAGAGFLVRSSPEPCIWPHDPRQLYKACWYRTNWESLRDAFIASRVTALEQPERYRELAAGAIEAQRRYCSFDALRPTLAGFLQRSVET